MFQKTMFQSKLLASSIALLILIALALQLAAGQPQSSGYGSAQPYGYQGTNPSAVQQQVVAGGSKPFEYITAIEDQSSQPSNFFVSTSDYNYAIVSDNFDGQNWIGFSVNDDSVLVITQQSAALTFRLSNLNDTARDLIAMARGNFTQNLVGLSVGSNAKSDRYKQQQQQPGRHLNYYNLAQSKLNGSLDGDVYYFDSSQNILEVFSTSVSVREQPGMSAVYRDHRYFSCAYKYMPLNINRFFLIGNRVIFVYNDGRVLLKTVGLLGPEELEIVVSARDRLKYIAAWQNVVANMSQGLDGGDDDDNKNGGSSGSGSPTLDSIASSLGSLGSQVDPADILSG